jgi:hypothetical protein
MGSDKVRPVGPEPGPSFSYNGQTIYYLPSDTTPGVAPPSSIEWDMQEVVSVNRSPFTGQTQTYDWQNSWWEGQVSFKPMGRYSFDMWTAFLAQCRGQSNAFLLGDPKAALPKGVASGHPQVNGGSQTGYSVVTNGWTPSVLSILLPGDFIQIGYRMYKVLSAVNSDSGGNATISIWPNLRDQPDNATSIVTRACAAMFTLKNNSGNKFSTNSGNYGLSGFAIKEAI